MYRIHIERVATHPCGLKTVGKTIGGPVQAHTTQKHNIFVISDEIYDRFIYDLPHVSVKQYLPEGTLVLGGMSKTWGMPGWRVGYALAPKWLFEKMMILQQFSFVCAPPPFQLASAEGLDFNIDFVFHKSTNSKLNG